MNIQSRSVARTAGLRKQNGFTLIEMMLAVAVMSILLTVGVPSYQDFVSRNRVSSDLNQMVASLQYTRSEAIVRNQRVSLCVSEDGLSCSSDADATWKSGWIIFSDPDGNRDCQDADSNNLCDVDNGAVLRVYPRLEDGYELTGSDDVGQTAGFDGSGFAWASEGTFSLCSANLGVQNARGVTLSTSGKVARTTDSNMDGVEEGVTCAF